MRDFLLSINGYHVIGFVTGIITYQIIKFIVGVVLND